jgi:hypothetical protein
MHKALGDDDRAKAALVVAVERKRTVAERRAVPRAHARTRGNGASLIADRRVRIRLLLSQRDDTGGSDRTGEYRERKHFPHVP